MKTREEIKLLAKEQLKNNYWNCVLAVLLTELAVGAANLVGNAGAVIQTVQSLLDNAQGIRITFWFNCGSLFALLLAGPLAIGVNYFFIRNVQGEVEGLNVGTPFLEAFTDYPRKLGGSLWRALLTFLWSLLFVIPGIIKSISYSMTPYILADCPNVKARDALKLSMRMMRGHMWEYFWLELSFVGWMLLSTMTMGILSIFYTEPYMNNCFAAYYLEVRDAAIRSGAVTQGQLDGTLSADIR